MREECVGRILKRVLRAKVVVIIRGGSVGEAYVEPHASSSLFYAYAMLEPASTPPPPPPPLLFFARNETVIPRRTWPIRREKTLGRTLALRKDREAPVNDLDTLICLYPLRHFSQTLLLLRSSQRLKNRQKLKRCFVRIARRGEISTNLQKFLFFLRSTRKKELL